MTGPKVSFGLLVLQIRRRLRMTQAELGEAIGYSPTLVSDIERGRREATLEFLAQLALVAARELDTPPDRLPPDGLLRAACAQCPVGQAYDQSAAAHKAA